MADLQKQLARQQRGRTLRVQLTRLQSPEYKKRGKSGPSSMTVPSPVGVETESSQAHGADFARASPEEVTVLLEESSEATEVYEPDWWPTDERRSNDSPVYVSADYDGWRSPAYQKIPGCAESRPTSPAVEQRTDIAADALKQIASPCGGHGMFFSPTRVFEDRSNENLRHVLCDVERKLLGENSELASLDQEVSNIVAGAAEALKVAGMILQNAIKQDSVMRRERYKLQAEVLQLKKAKLQLALERRRRTIT